MNLSITIGWYCAEQLTGRWSGPSLRPTVQNAKRTEYFSKEFLCCLTPASAFLCRVYSAACSNMGFAPATIRSGPTSLRLPSELAGLSSSHIHSDDIPSLLLLSLFKNSSLSPHIFAWITHRSVINPNDLTAPCFVLIKRSGKATVGGHLLGTVFAFCRHREQERVKQQGYDGAGRAEHVEPEVFSWAEAAGNDTSAVISCDSLSKASRFQL